MSERLDVAHLLNTRPLGSYRLLVMILCGLCLIMDGFDVQAIGYVAPAVVHEWRISKEVLAPVFGAGLLGMLIGSLIFSALADRIGRRPVLVWAMLVFSACMFFTGYARTIPELILLRFVTGLGLGAMMPNVTALVSEFSPDRIRTTTIMWVSCGYIVGGVAGGFVAAWLIPVFGWRSIFYLGGVSSLVIGLGMLKYLPESVHFLLQRSNAGNERIGRLVSLIVGRDSAPETAAFFLNEKKSTGAPFITIFRDGRARVTLLLWVINFTNLLNMYFLANWLPVLMHVSGHSLRISAMAGAVLWGGGLLGTLGLGYAANRFGVLRALMATLAIATFSTAAIGNPYVTGSTWSVLLAIFLSGFAIIGGQPAINAWAAAYYPTNLRSTGIGWSLGVGRVGSVVGPVVGGVLMHMQWPMSSLFVVAGAFAFATLVGVLGLRYVGRGATNTLSHAVHSG